MQVARRVHSLEYVKGHAETKTGRMRAVRYMPQALAEQVYLHPQSALSKAAPESLVYTQILRTDKRPYLAGKTKACLGSPVIARCCPKRGLNKCACTRSLPSQQPPQNVVYT